MRHEVNTRNPIPAPAEAVWRHIRSGENVGAFLPIITSCRVEGERRYCTTAEGSLDETIVRSEDDTRTFEYRIDEQDAFPVEGIRGVMRVVPDGPDKSFLHWDVTFETDSAETAEMMRGMVPEMYGAAAVNLGKLASTPA